MTLAAIMERRRVGYPSADPSPLSPVLESKWGQPKAPPLLVVPAVPAVPVEKASAQNHGGEASRVQRTVVRFQLAGCPPNTWAVATGAKKRDDVIAELLVKWPDAVVLP